MRIPPEHQPQNHRFVVPLDGTEALLEYRLLPDQRVDFYHTFVPPQARGTGVAESLVHAGLEWARQRNLHIHASCWYVKKFLD